MQHFYDGTIRRYLLQIIRALSNFTVKYSDGTLVRIPVVYGDQDRQVANIINQNSENTVNIAPRIAVYVTGIALDRSRLADATYVGKVHIRERAIQIDPVTGENVYNQEQGRNYTVERLMPTPYELSVNVDIWSSSTDQKLQILEQILVLFNPSLELQTVDNYIDWTSLTVLEITDVKWSNRTIPPGKDDINDIATIGLKTPIWISPPVRVKHLGIITSIITNVFQCADLSWTNIDGLGNDPNRQGTTTLTNALTREIVTITDYKIQVYNGEAILLGPTENVLPAGITIHIPLRQGTHVIYWKEVFDQFPERYISGVNKLFLVQPDGSNVIGRVSISPTDPSVLLVNWDTDTYPADTYIETTGEREAGGQRSIGTFDAIIDPQKVYPGHGMTNVVSGDRFLIIEDIGDPINVDGPDGWKNLDGTDFYAKANDIIEWQTNKWVVIFSAKEEADTLLYQTNIFDGKRIQYCWNGVYWNKSFEGEYDKGMWRLEL
jgi:hypothetical protein